jgi:predicted DNA-binding transcriptional regulator YafY
VSRFTQTERLIELVLDLRATTVGLTLDEIAERFAVSRRTAERMRDAVRGLFPELEERTFDDRMLRFRLPSHSVNGLIRWSAEEIAALETAVSFARESGPSDHAELLEGLGRKLHAFIERSTSTRLEPDVEALTEAEGLAHRPGPRARVAPGAIETLREAILGCRCVRLDYRRARTGERVDRIVHPYGFLHANRDYLVAFAPWGDHFRIMQLAGIDEAVLLDEYFERREDFDLRAYAANSFGVYQEKPYEVVWRFSKNVAESARGYRFHSTQEIEDLPNGALVVRFKAGGLSEMAFHAFTWGAELEVLEPKELRELLREMSEELVALYGE